MRGIGNKCLRKGMESMLVAVVVTIGMYYTGAADGFIRYFNPKIAQRMAVENAMKGTHEVLGLDTNPEL